MDYHSIERRIFGFFLTYIRTSIKYRILYSSFRNIDCYNLKIQIRIRKITLKYGRIRHGVIMMNLGSFIILFSAFLTIFCRMNHTGREHVIKQLQLLTVIFTSTVECNSKESNITNKAGRSSFTKFEGLERITISVSYILSFLFLLTLSLILFSSYINSIYSVFILIEIQNTVK